MSTIDKPLIVYIPDTRGVQVSRFGKGNLKIGSGVYTYSRLPGSPKRAALGGSRSDYTPSGTCPGSSPECESICYAARPVTENGAVYRMWVGNQTSDVPPIPEDAKLMRLHISGDFDTVAYIQNWITRLKERPDVTMWAYTRSWRIPELLPHLEALRRLPNVQILASIDSSIPELPPAGWRRAWIDGDPRAGEIIDVAAHTQDPEWFNRNQKTIDGTLSYVCPEETKHVPNCEACKYCFKGDRNDVTFLRH
jgi:hypothetical protein